MMRKDDLVIQFKKQDTTEGSYYLLFFLLLFIIWFIKLRTEWKSRPLSAMGVFIASEGEKREASEERLQKRKGRWKTCIGLACANVQ